MRCKIPGAEFRWNAVFWFGKTYRKAGNRRNLQIRFAKSLWLFEFWRIK